MKSSPSRPSSKRRLQSLIALAATGAASVVAAAVAGCAAALVLGSGCVHDVSTGSDAHSALFVAEGDDLLEQLGDVDADGYRLTPLIPATPGVPITRVGLRYDASGPVAVDARVTVDGGATFESWAPATLTFQEERANNAFVDVDVGALGGGEVTHVQLRFAAPVESELSFLAVDAFLLDVEPEVQTSTLTQGLAADGIVLPRSAWGARARSCNTASAPTKITVHHTETPTNDAMTVTARLRQIQNYHIDVRGWCDIGYHFLVGSDGNVYQGRRENTLGAHVANANSGNVGISFIGNFDAAAPSSSMMAAGARILGAVARTYGIAFTRSKIKTHREQGDTTCPGDALHARIDALIEQARDGDAPVDEPADTVPPECAQVQVTGASSLNVRPTPGTSQSPRGTLAEGDVVDVLSIASNGQTVNGVSTWYEIVRGTLTGFISGAYATCVGDGGGGTGEPPPPPPTGIYGGLTIGTAQIPRAGLANDTLAGALGVSTEPFGDVVTHSDGNNYVRGAVSHFGGPNDTGVTSTETGAVSGDRLRSLNSPLDASASTIASRPRDFYYIAMRWDYTPHGRAFWRDTARILVVNPANGARVVLRVVDWGPNTSTGRILDISPQAIEDLGATTDDDLLVAFAADGTALGVH